jgi:Ca2+-transporting ATPase
MDDNQKQSVAKEFEKRAKQGYRMLAFGYKDNLPNRSKYDRERTESDLIFLGFAVIIDPIRPEVKRAIATALRAGIRSVMITGDNELTALKIAVELGIVKEGDEVMLGADLRSVSDEQLMKIIERVKVFARTNPEDKLRIVKAFQKAGFSVAVTGDGVNDSLALKQAEIGVAMGKSGTDVAKEAADIVITDDNYATIISAIEEGRTIYNNMLKSVRYLLSTNLGEILTITAALIFGLPAPILPGQILWINLVSDGLPALALAMDPKDHMAMLKSPRDKQARLISPRVFSQLILIGLVVGGLSLLVFWYVHTNFNNIDLSRTWTFTTLILLQLIVAFYIHGFKSKFNWYLLSAVGLTILIQLIILFTPPLYSLFKITRPL